MLSGLIAEIGNHHFGDLRKAQDLIRAAKESGAHWVKMQAVDAEHFTGGSMPPAFYKQCELTLCEYLSCAAFGNEIGIPVFFSVFGPKFQELPTSLPLIPYKISGGQFSSMPLKDLEKWNAQKDRHVVISVPKVDDDTLLARRHAVSNMSVMYVTPYLPDEVDFSLITRYSRIFGKPVGYSDHTRGIGCAIEAIEEYGCALVEKHFNIYGPQYFEGQLYRDSIHAADPYEMERLSLVYRNAKLGTINAMSYLPASS